MASLVLLVVAAAWAAVLIPPLLRSRIENRPNSSVTDFRNQLSSLQRAMPSRSVTMRSMARPLAPSPLSRPAATGRPQLRSGVRTHPPRGKSAPAAAAGTTPAPTSRPVGTESVRVPARVPVRMHDASLRPNRTRTHGERPPRQAARPRRSAPPVAHEPRHAADDVQRRQNTVVGLLVGAMAGAVAVAVLTKSPVTVWIFTAAGVALCGYLVVLNQAHRHEARHETSAHVPARARSRARAAAPPPRARHEPPARQPAVSRGRSHGTRAAASRGSAPSRASAAPPRRRSTSDPAPARRPRRAGDFSHAV